MKYITAHVRPERVYHGYNAERETVVDDLPNEEFVEKIIKIERILSFTEDHIFIECPHNTVQTWEYEGSLADIKSRLKAAGMLID